MYRNYVLLTELSCRCTSWAPSVGKKVKFWGMAVKFGGMAVTFRGMAWPSFPAGASSSYKIQKVSSWISWFHGFRYYVNLSSEVKNVITSSSSLGTTSSRKSKTWESQMALAMSARWRVRLLPVSACIHERRVSSWINSSAAFENSIGVSALII